MLIFIIKNQILRLIDTLFGTESIGLIATAFGIICHAFSVDMQSQKKDNKSLKKISVFYKMLTCIND